MPPQTRRRSHDSCNGVPAPIIPLGPCPPSPASSRTPPCSSSSGCSSTLGPAARPSDARGSRWTFGLLLGAAGVATMLFPVRLEPGLVLDSRGLLLAISGFFFGLGPTAAPAPRRGASSSPSSASRSARCTCSSTRGCCRPGAPTSVAASPSREQRPHPGRASACHHLPRRLRPGRQAPLRKPGRPGTRVLAG